MEVVHVYNLHIHAYNRGGGYSFFPDRSAEATKVGEGPDFMIEKPIDEEGKLTYLLYNHSS